MFIKLLIWLLLYVCFILPDLKSVLFSYNQRSVKVDGASGNDKLHYYHVQEELPCCVLTGKVWCGNHAEHLVTLSCIGLFGIDLLNNLYGTSNFLGINGHWLRMLQAVEGLVSS